MLPTLAGVCGCTPPGGQREGDFYLQGANFLP